MPVKVLVNQLVTEKQVAWDDSWGYSIGTNAPITILELALDLLRKYTNTKNLKRN